MSLAKRYPRAIVTGASRGLGRAFAEMLLSEGVEVWGTARKAESLFKHERLHPCSLDLSQTSSFIEFLEKISRECPGAELLINNAGFGVFAPFEEFPVIELSRELEVMLTGPMRLCRAIYPQMLRQKNGAIVNVSSLAADMPLPMMPVYNAAKAGLSRFSRTLELESRGSGVMILDFQPGDYRTDFNKVTIKSSASSSERKARAWASLEKHLNEAPLPEKAAQDLRKALLRGRSGVVHSGGFFQTRIATLGTRLLPWSLFKKSMEHYYHL